MKTSLLALPLLLAACAPAFSSAPKPQPGEVVMSAVSPLNTRSEVGLTPSTPENAAGIVGFASISAMIILQSDYQTGLPADYDSFHFTDGKKSMNILSAKGAPLHVTVHWQAKQLNGSNVIDVHWESKPLGGTFLGVKVKATSTDPQVDTRRIEDALLNRMYRFDGVTLVASGR